MSLLGRPRLPAPIFLPGGKSRLVHVLLPLVPYGNDVRIYAEPYCVSAALFFAKRPHPIEVLNDLDQRLVNLFRTLQDPEKFSRLKHRLRYTPYARAEFERALEILEREDADPGRSGLGAVRGPQPVLWREHEGVGEGAHALGVRSCRKRERWLLRAGLPATSGTSVS
jgi:hypothetical protein